MFCKTKTKPKVSEKKGATGQSFIRKEITTYRIATLALYEVHKPPKKLYLLTWTDTRMSY